MGMGCLVVASVLTSMAAFGFEVTSGDENQNCGMIQGLPGSRSGQSDRSLAIPGLITGGSSQWQRESTSRVRKSYVERINLLRPDIALNQR